MGKVVFITGATSGLGKACAEHLATLGHTVYGTGRRQMISSGNVKFIQMDVTNSDSVSQAIGQVIKEHGHIDVVLNNAGMGIGGAAELATPEEINLQMNTNFMGTVNVCSVVLPHMRKAKQGTIVNFSSLGGVMGLPFQAFYSASKFAIEGYSEALSLELKSFHINVCLIEPGDFATGFTASRVLSEITQKSDAYGAQFAKTLKNIEKEEQNGFKPIQLAKVVARIVNAKHPKFRYKVGNIVQVGFAKSKAWVPDRTYQFLLRFFYNMV
ncbi:3-ketodihydrosphingosine reductase [Microbacter margulisiae]|uniref:NAD(P)-dependent dehydrogenase (Short-subunit alcohol dehydrogenase family) n=1 Tax=Microbacter margulisiae TaxID=1350067 RepID=A0A7W5DR17_9PORP|nr:SDR family oxidoreductase [Microbacter margulisiae]MBB3187133.1 NAD(P)-dependent dehydrogenase (short-subunit alcohol dehydrogenase family) [Microbacter margulisiae]